MKKIIIPAAAVMLIIAISLIGISLRSSRDPADMADRSSASEIIYVPGWKNKGISQHEQLDLLKTIFHGGSSVSVSGWDSDGEIYQFDYVVRKADNYAAHLASEIASFPGAKQRNLVLVGHSLGGRIVIRTMALLQKKGISIRRGIFLGAAIPDDDPDIESAMKASICPNINIYNRQDTALRLLFTLSEDLRNALGAYGCALPFRHCRLQQFAMKGKRSGAPPLQGGDGGMFDEHDARFYLERLAEVFREKEESRRREIESAGGAAKFFRAGIFWSPCSESSGYRIERNCVTGTHRLISPGGRLLLAGSPERCREAVDSLEKLDETNSASRIAAFNVLQDKANPPVRVIDRGWETLDEFHDWRLQRNWLTHRILDPRDYQRAHGSGAKMRAAFEDIKVRWRQPEGK